MSTAVAVDPQAFARAHPAGYAALASRGKWRAPAHIRYLCGLLVKVWSGEIPRLAISCPPRHGKSLLVSQYFPGWWLGTRPTDSVILTSYQERLVRKWSRRVRDDLAQWGPSLWGHGPHPRASTSAWDMLRDMQRLGGGLDAVGTGGALTGKGAHLLICDDLFKGAGEAGSDAIRESVWDWFTSEALTRLEAGLSACVVVFTRWHHDDVIGRLMRAQDEDKDHVPWTFVNLPALAIENDPLGRKPGEALWPERFPVERLDKIRREVGPYVWEALYQGHPTPAEGGMFKKSWMRYYDLSGSGTSAVVRVSGRGEARVDGLRRFATCDLATSKKSTGDYTAIAIWGYHPGWSTLMLLDMVHGRIDGPDLVPTFRREIEHWGLSLVFVERAGYQLAALQEITRAQQEGLPVVEIKPEGDKVARAMPMTAMLEGGRMLFPRGARFLAEMESELLAFPRDVHDDMVDALAYGTLVCGRFADGQVAKYAPKRPDPPSSGGRGMGGRGDGRWRIGR